MNCLDCAQHGHSVAAVGVCAQCGGAVCAAHAEVGSQVLTCIKPVYRMVTTSPAARRRALPGLRPRASCARGLLPGGSRRMTR
jgi:hypothetical protein